jgi:hypothetical protein
MNNLMMHDPDLLKLMIDLYFEAREIDERPPTVPGLVLAMGFNRVHDIVQILEKFDSDSEKHLLTYPEESIIYIIQALTMIEDNHLTAGLRDRMPASLVKFTLGAYHNVKEPGANQNNSPTNVIQIAFEQPVNQISMRDTVNSALSMDKSPKMIQHTPNKTEFEVRVNGK